MGLLSFLSGSGSNKEVQEYLSKNAVIIDVRTPGEFNSACVKGSINIPLDVIDQNIDKIKSMNRPVVLCCQSGMRSGKATSIVKGAGIDAVNGGGWASVNQLV